MIHKQIKNRNICAIITARGGSKGLTRKNLRLLAGKPLIAYSIMAGINCPYISRCIVSTEDAEIKQVSLEWGAEVIDRPEIFASDYALSQDVVRHVLESLEAAGELPDYFVLLQPTSPLRRSEHITACLDQYFTTSAACAISVTEVEYHPYKTLMLQNDYLKPFVDIESLDKPRQILPRIVRQNGAIYVMSSKLFLDVNSFYAEPAMPFFMTRGESIDIDEEYDLLLAEFIMKKGIKSDSYTGD
ncbi:MAG: acylneuraminate cytidylyltransferase family protein [Clostridiaceae bacterium]|nr:acylneuraminate cytidylyltransferase family protein [Clostridiaceae bacterium]